MEKGMLKIARTDEEASHFQDLIRLHLDAGEQASWFTTEDVLLKEKHLHPDIKGAMYIGKDAQVSAPHVTKAFLKGAQAYGAVVYEKVQVEELLIDHNVMKGVKTKEATYYSDQVIVSAGAWSECLLQKSSLELPMYPVKGECLSVKPSSPLIQATIFSEGCYFVPKQNGRILIGATVKPYTYDQTVTFQGIQQLMERAVQLMPALQQAEMDQFWAGIRPQTLDGLPYLGAYQEVGGLCIATGHYRNGILLAPATGELIADLVEGKEIDPVFREAFDPQREVAIQL
ncbi:glycine oxidase [Gracilibacillus halophilus YIM-C55.5]|uniref:Glycine oxidase n=1 Tax=Gracilibacillus halophilus YIM-C55.5 TaxID=1308866 RepID=N4WQV6_9BACI|nr:FAD-dependent oxidoreductase [Gracilibacillus halophilus]ENH95576.1 glycine oxidase [Gracilibacillus halophilus YIM-C55.5]